MTDTKIKIIIRVSEDSTFEADLDKDALVKDLKVHVEQKEGTPFADIKLIFKGRILKDE
jgi:hypothetical protein